MARYTVVKSIVQIVGKGWYGQTIATEKDLCSRDLANILEYIESEDGNARDGLEQWLLFNTGDFQSLTDFYAELETDEGTVTIDWEDAENGYIYNDCMYSDEFEEFED